MQTYTPQNPFDAYCWAHGFESNAAIGKAFKVSGEMVRKWRLPLSDPDFCRPSQAKMEAINTWSKGVVTPNHFFNLRGGSLEAAPRGSDAACLPGQRRQTAAGALATSPAASLAGGVS